MRTMIVNVKVLRESVAAFVAATLENAAASRREPGIGRFELLQDESDSCRFVLVESYRDAAAQEAHRETPHYKKWKDQVEPMMAEPRTRATYLEPSAKPPAPLPA
jgi:(4S)-4-hydroxy-5-phosphonooxypentane-2,3-dione isomerase